MAMRRDVALYRRIGYAVMRLRRRRGWTVLVLAERAGLHRNTIYRVESGLNISIYALWRIAEALGVALEGLIAAANGAGASEAVERRTESTLCGVRGR